MTEQEKENKVVKFLAPNLETQKGIRNTFKDISYYLIIAIVTIIAVFVVPLFSGCLYGDFGLYFPKTKEAWILFWAIRLGVAGGNVAIFILFKLQARTNVRKDPNYIEANHILASHVGESKEFIPRSPKQMNSKEYITKIVTIFVTSLFSSITISALVISFDFVTFLSCIVSTIISLCFGWVTMIKNEIYWTEEYLEYAKYIDKQFKESSQKDEELSTEVKEC